MKNLKILREETGLSQKEFANICKISPSTYNQYETGKRQPDIDTLKIIATNLKTSVDQVIGQPLQTPTGLKIPVFSQVAAGIPINAIQEIEDYEEIDEKMASTGEYFGLIIKGDSMEPRIKNGDVIIVRSQPDADTGDIAIILIDGEQATCKKIKKTPEGLMLISTNPNYEPMFFTNKQIEQLPIRIIGKVVELRAKF